MYMVHWQYKQKGLEARIVTIEFQISQNHENVDSIPQNLLHFEIEYSRSWQYDPHYDLGKANSNIQLNAFQFDFDLSTNTTQHVFCGSSPSVIH